MSAPISHPGGMEPIPAMKNLARAVSSMGKPEWRPMLRYVADLHAACTHPAQPPFLYPWEEIGTGYCYGPAFGHWDIVHAVLDSLPYEADHAKQQLLNYLSFQTEDGLIPGSIWFSDGEAKWSTQYAHPPVWPVAADEYHTFYGDLPFLSQCYGHLIRQIRWFDRCRRSEGGGYFYASHAREFWESGVDDGVRYDQGHEDSLAFVDATSHVYQMVVYAGKWSRVLGSAAEADHWYERAGELADFISGRLYVEESGFFYDAAAVHNSSLRRQTVAGMWPLATHAATPAQADRVIDEYLLDPRRFFTEHPIPSLGLEDPGFELRMWRGPTWNSMTYWAARGCASYGRTKAAARLLERALHATSVQFARTGTIWEFYHPQLGEQKDLTRKPYTEFNAPCRDYLGHCPVIAMARLWSECSVLS